MDLYVYRYIDSDFLAFLASRWRGSTKVTLEEYLGLDREMTATGRRGLDATWNLRGGNPMVNCHITMGKPYENHRKMVGLS